MGKPEPWIAGNVVFDWPLLCIEQQQKSHQLEIGIHGYHRPDWLCHWRAVKGKIQFLQDHYPVVFRQVCGDHQPCTQGN